MIASVQRGEGVAAIAISVAVVLGMPALPPDDPTGLVTRLETSEVLTLQAASHALVETAPISEVLPYRTAAACSIRYFDCFSDSQFLFIALLAVASPILAPLNSLWDGITALVNSIASAVTTVLRSLGLLPAAGPVANAAAARTARPGVLPAVSKAAAGAARRSLAGAAPAASARGARQRHPASAAAQSRHRRNVTGVSDS